MDIRHSIVDLGFPLLGTTIPADHAFCLFSAISRLLPQLHGDRDIAIHPIRGTLVGQRMLALVPGRSMLTLRLPADRIGEVLRLAGRRLDLTGSPVRIGVPTVNPLQPSGTLASRLVTIRGFTEPGPFVEALERQKEILRIVGRLSLEARKTSRTVEGRSMGPSGPYIRRTVRIHDKEVVGFAVRVDGLNDADSIRLQHAGLGGRRRFGCGVFVPARRVGTDAEVSTSSREVE